MGRSPNEGNDNPLQYSGHGKSHGQRSLEGCSSWGHKEYLLNPDSQLIPPYPFSPLIMMFSMSVSPFQVVNKFIYVSFFLILHKSDTLWWLSFFVRLILLSMIISRLTHVATNSIISFSFNGWAILLCVCVCLCVYVCVWTLRLLPYLSNCKQCCCEHWGACIFSK